MNIEEKKQFARDYMRAFKDRDEARWDDHVAPDFVRHDPGLPFAVRGPTGLRRLSRMLHSAFSDINLLITHVVAEGDKVLVHLRMQGRHTGDFNGTPATEATLDAEVMDLFRVVDGKLIEHWALMDNLTMLKQIGAVQT